MQLTPDFTPAKPLPLAFVQLPAPFLPKFATNSQAYLASRALSCITCTKPKHTSPALIPNNISGVSSSVPQLHFLMLERLSSWIFPFLCSFCHSRFSLRTAYKRDNTRSVFLDAKMVIKVYGSVKIILLRSFNLENGCRIVTEYHSAMVFTLNLKGVGVYLMAL
jgi:hypothetical protein